MFGWRGKNQKAPSFGPQEGMSFFVGGVSGEYEFFVGGVSGEYEFLCGRS